MLRIQFTAEEIQQLRYERYQHPPPRVQRKMDAVYLNAMGLSHQKIGRLVDCTETTVRSCFKAYAVGGIDALERFNPSHHGSDLEAHTGTIQGEFEKKPPGTIREAAQRIETLTQIHRSPPQIRAYLKKKNFKYRKVGPIQATANPEVQATFLETQWQPILDEAKSGLREVFFVDAVHFVVGAFPGLSLVSSANLCSDAVGTPTLQRVGGLACHHPRRRHLYQHGLHELRIGCPSP